MGALDTVVSNVLTRYKADTSDAKRAVKDLRGVEKQAARDRLTELEQTNQGIDKQLAFWGKLAGGIGLAYGAFKVAQGAANNYLEDLRLQSAAAGANIDGLTKATAGLVEEDKLLEFAGKAQHGMWKLNQEQMEQVLKGAMAVRKQFGTELTPTIEAFAEAVSKGSTKSLKEFGIQATTINELLGESSKKWTEVGGNANIAGDDIRRAQTSMSNSVDNLSGALGKLVVQLGPAIEAFAELVGLVSQAIDNIDKFTDWALDIDNSKSRRESLLKERGSQYEKIHEIRDSIFGRTMERLGKFEELDEVKEAREIIRNANDALAQEAIRARSKMIDDVNKAQRNKAKENLAKLFEDLDYADKEYAKRKKGKSPKYSGVGTGQDATALAGDLQGGLATLGDQGASFANAAKGLYSQALGWQTLGAGGAMSETDQNSLNFAMNDAKAAGEELIAAVQAALAQAQFEKENSIMYRVFGGQEDADHAMFMTDLAVSSLQSITNAAGDAWVSAIADGENWAASMNKAVGNVLRGLSKEFFIRSLGAFATGNFATGGAYLAASTAAALAARELGSSGGSTSQPSRQYGGAMNHAPRTNGNDKQDERHIQIILGSGFYDETPREQRTRLAKAVKAGMRETGSNTIKYM